MSDAWYVEHGLFEVACSCDVGRNICVFLAIGIEVRRDGEGLAS
jgi:hypothetical protein